MREMNQKRQEIQQALEAYNAEPTEENLKNLKMKIWEELFELFCLARNKGISLDECIDLIIEKDRENNDWK